MKELEEILKKHYPELYYREDKSGIEACKNALKEAYNLALDKATYIKVYHNSETNLPYINQEDILKLKIE